jgi:hypothetical protein
VNPVLLVLTSVLMVHPVVDEDTSLRLVALGTEDETVAWFLDDEPVATTHAGQAVTLPVPAGSWQVRAETDHAGTWEIHVRPDPDRGEGAMYVQGWSATNEPVLPGRASVLDGVAATPALQDMRWLWAAALAGLVVALWPTRRPKTP